MTTRQNFQVDVLDALEAFLTGVAGTGITGLATGGRTGFEKALLDKLATIGSAVDITYLFQAQDIGAGDIAEVIRGPAGKRGVVKAVSVFNVTEQFNTDTTEARVDVGDGADDDAYALSGDFGALDVAEALSPAITFVSVIPADVDTTLTFVAPTGGTPAGIADVQVTIRWFD